ncbi:hypothetical protein A6A11_00005 [Bisgaardia hudsonensis]|uniref:TfoX/Sxy family protein n=1 Tax=Bisgaardia hudsonensis TaxID=109472 RepID=UPI00159E5234|nr:TfoX/Sxy family protein [Bisgaardia hudsonensis]QLB13869.1 hypothetical protein A6A11_00005 [Bisgaardia hudsonensis]
MKITLKSTEEIRNSLNELIGSVTAKNLFTGYGLFKDNIMFGLYQNGTLYIRAEDKFAKYLQYQGAVSYLTVLPKSKLNIGNYYRLPKILIEDKILYKKILIQSIEQAKAQKIAIEIAKKNRIKDLFNLSIKHERFIPSLLQYS